MQLPGMETHTKMLTLEDINEATRIANRGMGKRMKAQVAHAAAYNEYAAVSDISKGSVEVPEARQFD